MAETTLSQTEVARGEFRIGAVVGRVLNVVSRHWLVILFVIALGILPNFVLTTAGPPIPMGRTAIFVPGPPSGFLFQVLRFLSMAPLFVGQAVVARYAFAGMARRPVRFGALLGSALGRVLPMYGLYIVYDVAIGLGALLFVIPALMMMAAWEVAPVACAIERIGPFGSLERSASLTEGHRWKVFGLALFRVLLDRLGTALFASLFMVGAPLAARVALFLGQVVFGALGLLLSVAIYHELRVAKDGIDIDQIVSVFD